MFATIVIISIFLLFLSNFSAGNQDMSGRGKSRQEEESFPNALEEFGYHFVDGKLVNTENGEPFQFVVKKNDRAYNQKHYEALGDVITDHVYELLEKAGLQRIYIPEDARRYEVRSFFFASPDAWTNEKGLLVLINGSGAVRAGQWARSLIINDCLDSGTQLPYIRKAFERGFGVVVLNTNLNRESADVGGRPRFIKGSEDPTSHAMYVWEHFISKAKCKHVAVVAHSAGGIVTMNMAEEIPADFAHRLFAVALTDSVHGNPRNSSAEWWQNMRKIAQNWVSSSKPLDTPSPSGRTGIKCVSAGTTKHEVTSHSAIDSVFAFIDEKYREVVGPEEIEEEEEEDEEEIENIEEEEEREEEIEELKEENTSSDSVENELDTSIEASADDMEADVDQNEPVAKKSKPSHVEL